MTWLSSSRNRLFIGAFLISLSPVWVRLVDVSPTASGFYRVIFGGGAIAIYLLLTGKRLDLSRRAWQMLVIASVFFALDLWFWHRSILYVGPGLATLLGNFQIFVVMIIGIVFLREIPHFRQVIAVPLALAGLAMIVGIDWRELPENYQLGVIFGLLTAVAYAGYILSLRSARKGSTYRIPSREVAVVSLITAAIMAATIYVEGGTFAIHSIEDVGWLLAYGVLSHCIGWIFITSSLSEVTAVEAGLALLLQPTLSFVWDILFFARPMAPIEIAGAAIALFAIYLGSRPRSKQA